MSPGKYYSDEELRKLWNTPGSVLQWDKLPPGWELRTYDDPVNPSHYKGDIECIDYQKSISTPEEFRGYLRLQAVKYIHRLNAKDTPTTNIDKALWYLNRLKKELENV